MYLKKHHVSQHHDWPTSDPYLHHYQSNTGYRHGPSLEPTLTPPRRQQMYRGMVPNSTSPCLHGKMACPLYLSDPQKYQSCRSPLHALGDAAAVREHVETVHRRPFYCPACGEVFGTASESNRHIRTEQCAVRDLRPGEIEGVHEDIMDQLGCWEAASSQSEEERWYSIWDILFPGAPRPESPYLTPSLGEKGKGDSFKSP